MRASVTKVVEMKTRFTLLTGTRFPVMQEGLGPYKTVHLAAAVANAGGLGTVSIPGITEDPVIGSKMLRGYIEEACSLTDGILAVNVPVGADKATGQVLPFSAAYVGAVVDAVRDPGIAKRLRVITTSAGAPGAARRLIENSGLLHFHKVGGTKQAIRAEQDGVDAIIASGYEAGGHTHSRPVHTFILVPSVVEAVSIPVILAGGARDGRSLAVALAMGADAVAFGTRFVASQDNPDWDPAYAKRIIDAQEGDDVVFSAIYGPSRALFSEGLTELAAMMSDGADNDSLTRFKDARLISGQRDGDMRGGILPAGQIAGALNDMIHVAEFVPGVVAQAVVILRALAKAYGGESI
jgi:NAD(P)H-dependent flavin oxidoreductase YrpB (nitropropane dioxygenase family)